MKRVCLLALAALALVSAAHATGPENWVVVANTDNPDSVTIAEEYVRLRLIPASNLIRLSGVPSGTSVSVDDFRSKILLPILTAIKERGLTAQIDGVAYAPGFPYAVATNTDVGTKKLALFQTQPASLTGLTFLYEQVLSRDPNYLDLDANRYARRINVGGGKVPDLTALLARSQAPVPATATANEKQWLTEAGKLASQLQVGSGKQAELLYNLACALSLAAHLDDAMLALTAAAEAGWRNAQLTEADTDLTNLRPRADFKALVARMRKVTAQSEPSVPFHNVTLFGGRRYLLSALLGYIGPTAETVEQVLLRLARSTQADGTNPAGTIYYMASSDWARTGPRQWAFPSAVSALAPLKVKAENLSGVLPPKGAQVAGAMVGAANFDWKASGATLLPGAFCDHLTSFGGVMTGAGQTLLTEFLKNGAAGACGTVTEPYNVPGKFPTPFVHVYYAAGATLAEAFYQSVTGPYQQLLIGDPLCRPWGSAPLPAVSGLTPNTLVKAPRRLTVSAPGASRLELFIDGKRRQVIPAGKPIVLDPRGLAPGTHELRIVSVTGPQECTRRTYFPFRTGTP